MEEQSGVFLLFCFALIWGVILQGCVAYMEELGGEWEWGAWCDISEESIKNYI